MNKQQWISLSEYEQKVYEQLGDKPVIKMLKEQEIPFENWGANIHRMVDQGMGAVRETRVLMISDENIAALAEQIKL